MPPWERPGCARRIPARSIRRVAMIRRMTEERKFPATAILNRDWRATPWSNPECVVGVLATAPGMVASELCCGDEYYMTGAKGLTEKS